MPHFEVVSLPEAMRQAGVSKRDLVMQEYQGYIGELRPGQAGKLLPSEGETSLTLRRRLTSAAKQVGKEIEVKRFGDEVLFWLTEGTGRRRGRPPKVG